MDAGLLEREAQLGALAAAVVGLARGRGSAVLVTGEAGIGKSSVVRAFLGRAGDAVRVLSGTCDDLLTPRTLGPLRDAALGTGGPLEQALGADAPPDAVFVGMAAELTGPRPTVLVIEDVHWADDATLDVLRYVARRLDQLRVLLVLTFRDNEVGTGHPLQELLGALAGGQVCRLALPPLSADAVGALAAGSGRDPAQLHRLTAGNPFYVTEALAAGGPADGSTDGAVPATVVDAVLARVRRLGAEARAALEQLSVVPSHTEVELAAALLGDGLDALAEAEERGLIEVRQQDLVFRHELARHAIERVLPAIRRRALNRAVLAALLATNRPDPARLVHHAIEAKDVATVLAYAPIAGRQASAAGSHRQALAHFEAAIRHADRLPPGQRATLLDDYAWELHIAHRFAAAVQAGLAAVALHEQAGERVSLGEALLRLARYRYLDGRTDEAESTVRHAGRVLEPAGSAPAVASAESQLGAILALTGRAEAAVTTLEQARRHAADAARTDLVALCLNYLGVAMADLGDPAGLRYLWASLATAIANGDHESVARAYTNLGELLYRNGHWDELAECLAAGLEFTSERGFWSHAYNLAAHEALLLLRRGDWATAEQRLRPLVDAAPEAGMLYVYSVPTFARLLARRGDPGAEPLLATAWDRARRQRSLLGLSYAGIAYVEWAWLNGRPERAAAVRDVLLPRTEVAGAAPVRGELARYLARAGLGVDMTAGFGVGTTVGFGGCLDGHAAGLRGDWSAAAAAWERAGDPYEQALELAESGEVEPTLRALRILDGLGAAPAAALVRRRLKGLGVRRVPRGVLATTRANPAGLTQRQVDVLALLATGMTNAEIAEQLVVSVRTVDHHVSAILGKLGVPSRRSAAATAGSLGLVAVVNA